MGIVVFRRNVFWSSSMKRNVMSEFWYLTILLFAGWFTEYLKVILERR